MSRLTRCASRFVAGIWAHVRTHPWIVAILVARLVLGILYSVAVPMWEASDETGHFAFVKYLAQERSFPPSGQAITEWYDESHQPPLYYLLAALATFWIDTDDGLEPDINPHAFTGTGMGGVNIVVHSERESFPYRGTALAMHVARLVSVLISTAAVAVTYRIGCLLFPQRQAIALGAMGLNAFWPQFLFLGAVVTNDILVPLFSSLVILFLLRIAYRPGSRVDLLGLGVCLLGGIGTKMNTWGLIPFAVVVLMLIAARKAPAKARWWCLLLIWLCLSGPWWWLHGLNLPEGAFDTVRYGGVMRSLLSLVQDPLSEAMRLPWEVLPDALKYCSRTIWASFGWDNIGVEEWIYQLFIVLCLVGAVGLARFMIGPSEGRRRFGVAILFLGLVAVFAPTMYTVVFEGGHLLFGRLVAAAIPVLSLLVFLGLAQFAPHRHTQVLALVVSGGLCVLSFFIPFRYIVPAYARPPILSEPEIHDIQHALEVDFDNKIQLFGYDMAPAEAKIREAIVVTLYWRALSEMEENYTVGVHLVGPELESYGGRDRYPAGGNYATSLWRQGDILQDTYWLRIPRDFPTPSAGWVEVSLYLFSTGKRLPVVSGGGETERDSVLLGPVGVVAKEEQEYSIQEPLDYALGDTLALVGYDVSDATVVTLPVTLYWEAVGKADEDYTVFVHIFDEEGDLLGQHDSQPRDGWYPTSLWGVGRVVEDRHEVEISGSLSPGSHRLRIVVGMYLLETMERLPVFDANGIRVLNDEVVIFRNVRVAGRVHNVYVPLIQEQYVRQ